MDNLNTTITTYLEMLNETDNDRRAELVAQVWAEDGCWIDPPFEAEGHAAINEAIGGVQQQFAGSSFRQASGVDAHHDLFRFAWELVGADGNLIVAGIDVGQVADDGRFRRITGFLGPLPDVEAA